MKTGLSQTDGFPIVADPRVDTDALLRSHQPGEPVSRTRHREIFHKEGFGRWIFGRWVRILCLLGFLGMEGEELLGLLSKAPAQAYSEGKVLWEKKSPYNHILVTEDAEGLRTLWFERGGARQSVVKPGDPDHLALPYAQAMVVGLLLADRPQRVLVVGLGGGTIPSFLHHHYPKLKIDVVELDSEVVTAAKKFFGFQEDGTMRVYVGDGRKYIEETRFRYDVIFLDAFGADNVPPPLTTREFLQSCRRALNEGGLVVGNLWSRASNPLYDSMVRTYQEVFETLYILDVPGSGNRILFALPRKQSILKMDLVRRAREESRREKFRFDMGEPVEQGFRSPGDDGATGRVLLDRELVPAPPSPRAKRPQIEPAPAPVE